MGVLADDPAAVTLRAQFGDAALMQALRAVLTDIRSQVLAGAPLPSQSALIEAAGLQLQAQARQTLTRVINATGVVIHTNLGRTPLAREAVAALELTTGYANLELDLETGVRASRHDHLDRLIAQVTGAEGGFAVNNCAGAVLLALASLAEGRPVIVSRGELVEIGGGFRVPDIVAQSGSRLIEVGTTNRTHLRDYERALRDHPDARVILRTHPSNFRITGFTSAPSLSDLAGLAHAHGVILVEDLGGGALVDLSPYGIADEPMVQASIQAGVDLVIFSGDKLLGGPQAGLLAGQRRLVEHIAGHPLARALRLDKLSLAALAATLKLYRPPHNPVSQVPVLRMLTQTPQVLEARARSLKDLLDSVTSLQAEVLETQGYAGGGAMAMLPLPSFAVALRDAQVGAEDLARRLRTGPSPVVGRIERDRVLLDLRAVADEDLPRLALAVLQALDETDRHPLAKSEDTSHIPRSAHGDRLPSGDHP